MRGALHLWFALAVLGSCSGDGTSDATDSGAPEAEADADTDTDSDADTDSDTDTDEEPATLTGRVLDVDGEPVSGARVNICRDVCLTDISDEQGAYTLVTPYSETQAFYVVPPADAGLSTPIAPHTPAMGETLELDVVVPPLETATELPGKAEEVEVAEGLFLTVGADILEPAGFEELGDEIAAAVVSSEHSLPLQLDGEVLAQWYIDPFEATSESGVSLRLANQWSLSAGETYDVVVAGDPYAPGWLDAGSLTVTDDGSMLEGDATLPMLTSLVLLSSGE